MISALEVSTQFPCLSLVDLFCSSPLKTSMNLEEAVKLAKESCDRLNERYGGVVFDEWVIVSFAEIKEKILAYSGPRREHFKTNFSTDVQAVRKELHALKHNVGDFEFARHAAGTHFDAFLVIGKELFLICNSTNRSMQEITKHPNWLNAQVEFAAMSEKFRAGPLALV